MIYNWIQGGPPCGPRCPSTTFNLHASHILSKLHCVTILQLQVCCCTRSRWNDGLHLEIGDSYGIMNRESWYNHDIFQESQFHILKKKGLKSHKIYSFKRVDHLKISAENSKAQDIMAPWYWWMGFSMYNLDLPYICSMLEKKKCQKNTLSRWWSGWWLNQPIWRIWSSNWIISMVIYHDRIPKKNHQLNWLVVEPTHLKNISQIGSFPQIGMKIKTLKPPPSQLNKSHHSSK